MTIYHKHHIIPKHMGGTDEPSNLVELTIEEHAEAHRKLYEEHGHWQDKLAYEGLLKLKDKESLLRELYKESGKLSWSNPSEKQIKLKESFQLKNFGDYVWKNHRDSALKARRKDGERRKGIKRPDHSKIMKTKYKNGEITLPTSGRFKKGQPHNEAHRKNISNSAQNRPKVCCIKCKSTSNGIWLCHLVNHHRNC